MTGGRKLCLKSTELVRQQRWEEPAPKLGVCRRISEWQHGAHNRPHLSGYVLDENSLQCRGVAHCVLQNCRRLRVCQNGEEGIFSRAVIDGRFTASTVVDGMRNACPVQVQVIKLRH